MAVAGVAVDGQGLREQVDGLPIIPQSRWQTPDPTSGCTRPGGGQYRTRSRTRRRPDAASRPGHSPVPAPAPPRAICASSSGYNGMDALNLLASWAAIFDPVGDSSRGRRSLHAADPWSRIPMTILGSSIMALWFCRAWIRQNRGSRFSKKVALEPVTKQVTTAPGKGRRSTTYPDTEIPLNCGNQT
jgi:hypothetical protein